MRSGVRRVCLCWLFMLAFFTSVSFEHTKKRVCVSVFFKRSEKAVAPCLNSPCSSSAMAAEHMESTT